MKSKKIILFIIVPICVVAISFFAVYNSSIFPRATFYENTTINNIEVGNKSVEQTASLIDKEYSTKNICLQYETETLNIDYSSLQKNSTKAIVRDIFNSQTAGNVFFRNSNKNKNFNYTISPFALFKDLKPKIESFAKQFETEPVDASLCFDATKQNSIIATQNKSGKLLDIEKLENIIETNSTTILPFKNVDSNIFIEDIENNITLLSRFSTSFSTSTQSRKHNIALALNAFNNLCVLPGEQISFNEQTGERSTQNGYQNAKIIVGGQYVDGVGGGVCQSSTTLFNALLKAGIQINSVYNHSLPSSYVKLGFDAMVNNGLADLVFENNTNMPIYIKTSCTNTTAKVEIYGQKQENTYKFESVLTKVLPHNGDIIKKDTDHKFANKIMFEGEFLRFQYPKCGYVVKLIKKTYNKDNILVDECVIREAVYPAQSGIIMEGSEEIFEGITIPRCNVQFIKKQNASDVNLENERQKLVSLKKI